MIEDLTKLAKILDEKVKPLVESIEKADPTKEEYGVLLSNFSLTMTMSSNLNRTLYDVAARAQELAKTAEEADKNEQA